MLQVVALCFILYYICIHEILGFKQNAGKVMKIDSYAIKHLELFHDKLHKIYSKMYQTLPLINIIIVGACLQSSNPSAASVRIQSGYLFT